MKIIRRLGAVAVSGALVGAMFAGVAGSTLSAAPAGADSAEAFAGSASATALNLNILGIKLTVSQTHASADSTPKAHADAATVLGLVQLGQTKADAPVGANLTSTSPQPCNVNAPVGGILTITALCSQSAVAVPTAAPPAACAPAVGTLSPIACSTASVLTIDVNPIQVLQPLIDQLKTLIAPVDTTLGQVLTHVPVVTPLLVGLLQAPVLSGLNLNLSSPVTSLLTAVERATTLLKVSVLPAASAVETTTGNVVAAAEADGVTVDVLPNLTLNGGPLLSLKIGTGSATSTYNRTTCQSSATFHAAVLSAKLLDSPIDIGTGTLTLPGTLGTIGLGAGATTQNADGSVGAVADGLNINLLGGAIALSVGHAESVAGGVCAVVIPTTTTTTQAPAIQVTPTNSGKLLALPVTGPTAPLLPIGFFLVLAGFLTRRAVRSRR